MALLELRGITKAYDAYKVVDGFDFQVQEGELRCLLGPNGAGKTTALDLITGQQRLSSGTILFGNKDVSKWAEQARSRAGIGRKFQIPAVFKELTVYENLEVASSAVHNPFKNMVRFKNRIDKSRYEEVIELVNLKDRVKDRAGYLSHGETQWLEIGMVLMQNPRLFLMDEPTAGMTEQEIHKTSVILNRLKGSHTMIVVAHEMSFVREIANFITVMHMGKTLAEGQLKEIENNETVKQVYLGRKGHGDA